MKIYVLTIVELTSDGEVSFDTFKYDKRSDAEERGNEQFDEWVAEHCYEDENGDLCGVNVTRYPNLVEAHEKDTIAEFDYLISEFEV